MTDKAACTKCLDDRSHPWHDNGDVNLSYSFDDAAQPPSQESAHSCAIEVDGCDCAEQAAQQDDLDDLILAGERAVMSGPNRDSYSVWSQKEMETFARALIDQPVQDPDYEPLDLMNRASGLVYGDRQGAYGHPYDDYSRTAGMWSAFLGVEITPAQAALMMVLLKVSRERNRPKDDNIVDAHGYLLCYGRIQGRDQAA